MEKSGRGLLRRNQQDQISAQAPMPVERVDDGEKNISVASETVQLYYYNNTTHVLTTDAGQVAGTVVVGKLAYASIRNALGSAIANHLDSSLSFTSTAFTTEKPFPYLVAEAYSEANGQDLANAITTGFSNGDFCVDYRRGVVYGKKADNSTTLTSTAYIYASSAVTLNASSVTIGSVEADITKIGGQTIVADDATMTASPKFIPVGGEYRASATTYTDGDATILQTDKYGQLKVSGSSGVSGGGLSLYVLDSLNTFGHGTTAYTAATQFTIAGYSFSVNPKLIAKIERFSSANVYQEVLTPLTHTITESSGVFTVTGMSASAGDLFVLYIQAQERTIDLSLDSVKSVTQNPLWSRYTTVESMLSAAYELTASFADVGAEINVQGYNYLTLWLTIDIGTSTNPQLRILHKHTSAGSEEYREIYLGNPGDPTPNVTTINLNDYEIASDADQLLKITLPITGTAYVQIQAKDDSNGDGQIDALYVTKTY